MISSSYNGIKLPEREINPTTTASGCMPMWRDKNKYSNVNKYTVTTEQKP